MIGGGRGEMREGLKAEGGLKRYRFTGLTFRGLIIVAHNVQ